jgi:hypothetical protein
MVKCRTIHEDTLGSITRFGSVLTPGRVYYSAAGRCLDWDGREYHVTVVPEGVNINCWSGYDTEAQAREAIRTWVPNWPNHARDMARARR